MQVKVHFRITRDRAGLPADFSAARRFSASEAQSVEDVARAELAADYQVPGDAVIICKIEQ